METGIEMKRIISLVIVALTLSACATTSNASSRRERDGNMISQFVNLPDGRVVVCVTQANLQSGVSCDWDHAKAGE